MNAILRPIFALLMTMGLVFSSTLNAAETDKLFIIRTTQKSPADVVAAGMEYSAMLPCGNLSLYMKGGATQISLLDPGFMNILHPDPNLKKLGDETRSLFEAMLDSITK